MKITAALMLKAPRPGEVKTRLGREIGYEKAAAIYRVLAERQIRQIPNDWQCAIHFAPADAGNEVRDWLGNIASSNAFYRPQCEGDLGARMRHAVREELAAGAAAVVLLGGDCPDIDSSVLRNAEAHLLNSDAVIAPASDGGYVLLALKADHPKLFAGIPWSTNKVLKKTLAAAEECSLSMAIMKTFQDVDLLEDLPPDLLNPGCVSSS